MSIEIVARILNTQTGLHPTAKMVLIGLANHANPDGTHVFPSVARIARYAECDPRTVKRQLKALRLAGWIEVVSEASQHRPTEYQIRGDRLSLLESRGDTQSIPGVTPVSSRGDIAVSPEPSEPSENHPSVAPRRERDPIFETLAEIEGSDLAELTTSQRGALNKAAKELRDLGVEPAEIAHRAIAFARRYPGATLTAIALVRHWGELNGGDSSRRVTEADYEAALHQ